MCLIITIYNGTHKNMLLIIQTVFFICGFSAKVTCAFLAIISDGKLYRNKHFSIIKNDVIFHIFDQIKVSRVPL